MDRQTQWIVLLVIFLAAALWVSVRNRALSERKIRNRIERDWGRLSRNELSKEVLEGISHYHRMKHTDGEYEVDDITWNDLSMDAIYGCINNTYSSVGREYLYHMLKSPHTDAFDYEGLETAVGLFGSDVNVREAVQREFYRLGTTGKLPVCDYMNALEDFDDGNVLKHFLGIAAMAASVLISLFVNPVAGIGLFVLSVGASVISYYRYKALVEPYYVCVGHVARMAACGKNIAKLNISKMKEKTYRLKSLSLQFRKITGKLCILGAAGGLDGSLMEVVMDYVRILTHVDLICFHFMLKSVRSSMDEAWELMELLGQIESEIAIASFRQGLKKNGYCAPKLYGDKGNEHCVPKLYGDKGNEHCVPKLYGDKGNEHCVPESHGCGGQGVTADLAGSKASNRFIRMENGYHPLLKRPVKNSVDEARSMLITGSNASGKSTFLKTVAINQILAQSIHTCAADSYESGCFRIYSSMALRDDVVSGDSYYMVEIKSIKRIMDATNDSDKAPVLCVVDEVLRGTNTVERIAASSQILENISCSNALCIAATHDIELTGILENSFENYHFQETVTDDDVRFDYLLKTGKATSRNAIKLLGLLGYDGNVVEKAWELAARIEAGKPVDFADSNQ